MSDPSTTTPAGDLKSQPSNTPGPGCSPCTSDSGKASSALFDQYATSYDSALNSALASTGETREFYARRRIAWTAECASRLGVTSAKILDFGCGDGANASMLLQLFAAERVIGVDASRESVTKAASSNSGAKAVFFHVDDFEHEQFIDIAYCNGVFHHIPPDARNRWLGYILASLRPGGLFAFWENNPWNPGTRYVMAGCEFDRDAIPLSPVESTRRLSNAGFEILRRDSFFYFPRQLKFARPLERLLMKVPLGGQYQILCRKPR